MRRIVLGLIRPQFWIGIGALFVACFGMQHARAMPPQKPIMHAVVHVRTVAKANPLPDCSKVACLALTFDDGPNPLTTPQVLSILEQARVPATFFVIGSRVPGNEALLRRMHRDGDEIGNHSWTHPDFTTLTPVQIHTQIALTQEIIAKSGVPVPTLFRPPYGAVDPTVIHNVPLTMMFWNEDPKDWAANTPKQVAAAVEASAQPGGVVDMHDIYHVTANALPSILATLKARNYHFVTASQLLDLHPGQQGEFYGLQPSE